MGSGCSTVKKDQEPFDCYPPEGKANVPDTSSQPKTPQKQATSIQEIKDQTEDVISAQQHQVSLNQPAPLKVLSLPITTTDPQVDPESHISDSAGDHEADEPELKFTPIPRTSAKKLHTMNVAGASRERTGSSSSSVASQGSNNSPKHGTISPKTAASNGMMAGSSHGTSAQLGTIERVAFDGNIRKFLENHVLFQNLDESFIMQLNNAMQSRVCSPSEYVIRKGEVGRAMFFILRGEVEVVSEDGETILNVMKEQSFFGEIGVLFSVPRTASCRARGRCIILALTKEKLQRVMEGYPKVAEAIAMIAEERFALHMKQQDSAMKVEFGKELKLGITNKDLKSIPLFRDCEIGFLHMLALSLRPVQFKMGEVIIQKGDIASEMYFVVDGEAEVFSDEDGKVFANFHPGFFFGEVGLFFKIKRTASVRCTSQNITVFKLTKNDLDSVLAGYPEIDAKIKVEAKQRFEYNKMREMAKLTGKQEVETDIEVVREKLKTIPLFKGGSIGFFHELALTLKIRVFQPGDLIIQKDQPGRSMYFVVDGTADVISPDGKEVYGTMLANTFFGEVALFFDVNRTASVRARTVCTLFELEKDSLKKILSQHKQLKEQMYEKAEENFRLWQARQNALKQLGSSKDIQQFDVEATVSRLRMVSMFSKCPDNFLRGLATQTSVHSFGKEDIIVRNGDASTDMFFIVSGGVEIISDDGKQIYDSVAEGGFFGEVGLILNVNRTASVRCATKTCHLIILSASALEKVLEEYPESYQLISLEADKRHQLALTRKLAEKHTNLVIHAKAQRGPNEGEEDSGIAAAATAAALSPRSSDFDKSKTLGRSSGSSSSGNNDAAKSGTVVKDRKRRGSLSMSDKNEGLKTSIGNLFKRKSSKTGGEIHDHDSDDSIELSSEAVSRDSVADGALLRRNSSAFDKGSQKLGKMFQSLKNTFSRNDKAAKIGPSHKERRLSKADGSYGSHSQSSKYPVSRQTSSLTKHDHIFDIPETDLAKAFAYINPQERFRLRLICKRWANLLAESRFWSNMDFKPIFTRLDPELFLNFINLSGEFLTVLNLDSCWQVLDDELNALSSYCPNISKISLRNCWKITDRGVSYLTSSLRKMREIDFSYCGQINGMAFMDHKWSSLKKVNLTYCKQIGDAQLEKILCKTSDIAELRLRRCSRITDFGVFLVVRYCRHLKVLDLSDCEQISDKCLKWIASSCTELTDLNLRFCTRITNGGLYDLSLGCQSFRSLDLSFCTNLTDAAIVFFSDSIRSLRHLKMRKCKKITDGVATYLIRATPALEDLDLSGCPLISAQARMALQMCMRKANIKIDAGSSLGKKLVQRPRAVEVPLEQVFLSGPAELIRIPLELAASGGISKSALHVAARTGRRKSEGRTGSPQLRQSGQKRSSKSGHDE